MNEQAKPTVKKIFNSTIFFIKLDRLAAWILLFVIIAYAVTGFGMTKGIIDQQLAQSLHLSWLGAIGLIVFIIHTYHAIGLAFKRWRIWNGISRYCLFFFYVLMIVFFLYLQFFYSSSSDNYQVSASKVTGTNINTGTLPVYTASTLAAYNGLNGRPAYAVVNGLVYDFSRLFRGGNHQGYSAGQDLSSAFHGQHPNSLLNNYSVVGTYK